MTGYLRNNIGFRRFTAERYAEFYKAKAFMLSQLLDGDRHDFTPQARETLLQYFASATDWLMLVERSFIRSGHGVTDRESSEHIIESFAQMERLVHKIMLENPNDFSAEFSSVWIDMRERLLPDVSRVLNKLFRSDMSESFRLIADFVIGYMNYTLFNLHEVDYLIVKRDRPFIYTDKIDLNIMELTETCSPVVRFDAYKQHGLLTPYPDVKIRVKQTLDEKYISLTAERNVAYQSLRSCLDSFDIQFY